MSVALNSIQWQTVYPMDYYSNKSLGAWTNNNEVHRPVRPRKPRPIIGSKGEKSLSKGGNKKDDAVSNRDNLVPEKENKVTECACKISELEINSVNVSKEDNQDSALKSGSDSSKVDLNSCCAESSQNGCCISQPNS